MKSRYRVCLAKVTCRLWLILVVIVLTRLLCGRSMGRLVLLIVLVRLRVRCLVRGLMVCLSWNVSVRCRGVLRALVSVLIVLLVSARAWL